MLCCEGAVPAAPHPLERARLDALQALSLNVLSAERRFDNITALAAHTFGVPIALITLVDEDRQWFKSHHGLPIHETPRDWSFCAHALHAKELLMVEDARLDERFATNPLVTAEPHIRFYAGALIRSPSGLPLGTLCLIDTMPRILSQQQQTLLIEFARLVEQEVCHHAVPAHERTAAELRAHIDPLTHFATQRGFDQVTNRLLTRPAEDGTLSLIVIELNETRRLQRLHGLTTTKLFLLEFAKRLEALELDGLIFKTRLEVSTFGLLMSLPSPQRLHDTLERLMAGLHAPLVIDGQPLTCAMRIMWVENCAHFENASHILLACNYVRQLPRSQVAQYLQVDSDENLAPINRLIGINQRLPEALFHNRLALHYQPKIDVASHAITGLEALLRWDDREFGNVSPMEILAIAEELGLSDQLDTWVVRQAISQLMEWQAAGVTLVPVSINVTPGQLTRTGFATRIARLLAESDVDPALIEFEIIERALVEDFAVAVENMARLRELGVSFSIDDFGTGYSSLSYLNRLPADTLKIDRSFITGIFDDSRAASLVQSIIAIGHNAGMNVVAEGVETLGQHLMLRAYHCDEVQGFYFSRPLPADEIIGLLNSAAPFAHADYRPLT